MSLYLRTVLGSKMGPGGLLVLLTQSDDMANTTNGNPRRDQTRALSRDHSQFPQTADYFYPKTPFLSSCSPPNCQRVRSFTLKPWTPSVVFTVQFWHRGSLSHMPRITCPTFYVPNMASYLGPELNFKNLHDIDLFWAMHMVQSWKTCHWNQPEKSSSKARLLFNHRWKLSSSVSMEAVGWVLLYHFLSFTAMLYQCM